jgi:hypothetical protein
MVLSAKRLARWKEKKGVSCGYSFRGLGSFDCAMVVLRIPPSFVGEACVCFRRGCSKECGWVSVPGKSTR